MIEKRAFIHMPKAREAGVWVVVYYGSSRHFARASSRRFVWLGRSASGERYDILSKGSLEGAWMECDHRIASIQAYMALPAAYDEFEVPSGSTIIGESGRL